MNTLPERIYDGASDLGKFQALISLILAIIVFVIMFIAGAYLYFSDQSNLFDTKAIIKDVKCKENNISYGNKQKIVYNCNILVEYNLNGKNIMAQLNTNDNILRNINQTIDITYDINDPNNVSLPIMRNSTMGFMLSSIGLLILGGAYLLYYMTNRFKLFASSQGASTALSIVSMPFRT